MAAASSASRRPPRGPRVDKLIVTHRGALAGKYGARLGEIDAALKALIAADAGRGLATRAVALDDARSMAAARGRAVRRPGDERGTKRAIDALYRHFAPDYVLILGASDVVPHVHLDNPINERFAPEDHDDDETVPSDLPYACDAGFSTRPERFVGPTRVVGRLPDVVAATAPDVLLGLLGRAAAHVPRPRSDYAECFALSAKVWEDSTALSLANLFGPGRKLHTSPKAGPAWTRAQLAPRIHFINCHGNTLDPAFSGEFPEQVFFEAHRSRRLRARVKAGSVVAAECCYGAELYDPAESDGEPGICMAYLSEGACGYIGSTTTSYGPSEGNGQADLICQFALDAVLKGASLGRAMLEARQRFIAQYTQADPMDLKTVVQFLLLGDPSLHPVQAPTHAFARSATLQKAIAARRVQPGARGLRRERLARTGSNLAATVGVAVPAKLATPTAVRRLLLDVADESGLVEPQFRSWRVAFPPKAAGLPLPGVDAARRGRSMHALIGRREDAKRISIILATVQDGRVIHLRRVHSR